MDSMWAFLEAEERKELEDIQQDLSYIDIYRCAYGSEKRNYSDAQLQAMFPKLHCPDIIHRHLLLNLSQPHLWYILPWAQMWENTMWAVTREEPHNTQWKKMFRAAEKVCNRAKRRWNQKMGEEIYADVEDSSGEE